MWINRLRIFASVACLFSAPASAHEMWLEGVNYEIDVDEKIVSNLKVGQNFKGSTYSFFPDSFQRFDIALADQLKPVEGRLGNRPTVDINALGEGLNILLYQSNDMIVTYTEFDKFASFVTHKAFENTLAEHEQRGFPKDKFREVYSRYAKSLIGVGNARGADRSYGLETEIVALENPYTDKLDDGFDVKVLYQGSPRKNAQVEVFEKTADAEDDVRVFTTRTNDDGIATIAVKPDHIYQLDAVVIRQPANALAQEKNAVWETLWANMTFATP
ncbi:DUF4198 domain-containing protein [Ahrensia kielensis]|uniref:DUF4198 domain-containing protein n=1 Tax=Ahrensia kielensis TaxID=76980 RepID=UPI00036B65E5|nr:DUF4198 domain-containing protein [Ahrensia kielensis]